MVMQHVLFLEGFLREVKFRTPMPDIFSKVCFFFGGVPYFC